MSWFVSSVQNGLPFRHDTCLVVILYDEWCVVGFFCLCYPHVDVKCHVETWPGYLFHMAV